MLCEFQKFIGQKLIDVADEIQAIASNQKLSVNVLDPSFPKNIDVECDRLNVTIDEDFKITSFDVG
jgi:hypothetical protein